MNIFYSLFLYLASILFTFIIPGVCLVGFFYPDLKTSLKIPLILLSSFLLSTFEVYFLSLVFGYSRLLIFFCLVLWVPFLVGIVKRIKLSFPQNKSEYYGLSFGIAALIIFFIALFPAILSKKDNYYVMSGVNWQDTAMHLSITQSISQGNFPPQAPYFSGVPLTYYYFSDFHTAIMQTIIGDFAPHLFALDNAVFVLMYVTAFYAAALSISHDPRLSLLSSFLGLFNGNLMFTRFVQDVLNSGISLGSLPQVVIQTITNHTYTLEYGKLMEVTILTDYFLQNRPMMVGLTAIVLSAIIAFDGLKNLSYRKLLLSSLIAASLIKIQSFAFGAAFLLILLAFAVNIRHLWKVKKLVKIVGVFIPSLLLSIAGLMPSLGSNNSILKIIQENFGIGIFGSGYTFVKYLEYYFVNFGVIFYLALFVSVYLFLRHRSPENIFLLLWLWLMFLIPQLVKITPLREDMLKFFFIMDIPMIILGAYFLRSIWKYNLGKIAAIAIICISSFTSILVLFNSYLNKNLGYTQDGYVAGMWIRSHTPENSVFLTSPSVHSPPTDIGGRLRVLSYINWPYSHGYNTGPDNVFSRASDIETFYNGKLPLAGAANILKKYKVNYIYLGPDEYGDNPQIKSQLLSQNIYRTIYQNSTITILQINNQ